MQHLDPSIYLVNEYTSKRVQPTSISNMYQTSTTTCIKRVNEYNQHVSETLHVHVQRADLFPMPPLVQDRPQLHRQRVCKKANIFNQSKCTLNRTKLLKKKEKTDLTRIVKRPCPFPEHPNVNVGLVVLGKQNLAFLGSCPVCVALQEAGK